MEFDDIMKWIELKKIGNGVTFSKQFIKQHWIE